ncbi:OLC1v1033774C1 [Oldenlandia corymbosa var. corymbosa]|uniref:RING-type E3 ubiquitin transferase n=1 Tax=Oldenlandia corymbosa var. corymbosa TaxID=529605 RepID=A0AAV1CPS0_OLDCO|nr:OLC1v1033774C1 [Oldenlandia corymbosa var. corymbosa]
MRKIRRLIMALNIIFFAWLILAGNQPSTAISTSDDDLCAEQKCSPDGPAVRFPFVLQGKQPEYCGHDSSFNLHCDQLNRTILELPSSSIKVQVTNISYLSQMMEVLSVETCFAKHLRDLDISATPFWYDSPESYQYELPGFLNGNNYSLFNCSSARADNGYFWSKVDCLENNGYNVHATYQDMGIPYVAEVMESCTKMYDVKLVTGTLFQTDFLELFWSLPLCRKCELHGGICRWKGGSRNEIGCLRGNKHQSGILKKRLFISGKFCGFSFFLYLKPAED